LIDNHQNILERQQALLDRLQKCCDEKPKQIINQVVENNVSLPDYVRFGLDSYKIEVPELRKISDVADYLKKNPNSKLTIIGYADRKTGNPAYNLKLSQKRVDAVAAEFKRLGVNANRVVSEWRGDKEQPFNPNELNRVVVMIERK
jgi:outer membrane protein OmpA-like peptidoglycan-associated protein